jgi:hypothetical protein
MHIVRRGILRPGLPATSLLLALKLLASSDQVTVQNSIAQNPIAQNPIAQNSSQNSFSPKTVTAYSANPTTPAGAYWRLQQPTQPPLPYNPFPDLPVYTLDAASHVYLIDDSSVDYPALNESRAMESAVAEFVGDFEFMGAEGGESQSPMFALMYSSDELWLEITGVTPSDRTGYFVIHPPSSEADGVYDLFATTNLSISVPGLNGTNWTWLLRTEPGHTNLAVNHLTASECFFRLGRTNDTDGDLLSDALELLVNHSDPTNPSTAGNGVPDFWMWENFGSLQPVDGDYDHDGYNNLTEYQYGLDPNSISFTPHLGYQHFNTANVSGSFITLDGVPAKWAVLVNSTNESAATWQTYAENFNFNLGATDGVYDVMLGLKGRASNSVATWIGTKVLLDRVAPVIAFTNPTTPIVTQPKIQLQGYALESLASVFFDVSNAVEVITNQDGFLIGQYFDTNSLSLTTNYFQCFDIPLALGLNTITVYARDLASNLTVTNLNIDCSLPTNPPTVQIEWPANGTRISGTNFNWCGNVSDPTAAVTAQTVDGNGNTNSFPGIVERNGKFWVNNLPLNGTNTFALTVTDSGGNVATTNVTVIQHPLAITLNPVSASLWLPKVNVSGTISDATYAVWVNGVKGSVNTNGTWTATEVPVTPGGIASFTIRAYAPGELQPDGSIN